MTPDILVDALIRLGMPEAEAVDSVSELGALYATLGEGVSISGQTDLGTLTLMLGPDDNGETAYALTLK